MSDVVEVRCPVGPRRLFTKLKLGEEFGRYVNDVNLIEFTCSDCAKHYNTPYTRYWVYHRFNFLGELISTSVEVRDWSCGGSPEARVVSPTD